MIFRQIAHEDLGCASYLVGDEDAGVAAVVDPRLDIGEYLRLARYLGVSIEHILETHNHADHVSGHGRLAAATGALIHVHELAAAEYEHEAFTDGWELALGSVVVRAVHTPGHRPEHTAFLLIDTARGRGAVGGADRRLAVRRRHRAARPGGREGRGRARDLLLAARAARALRRRRGLARPPRRVAVRRAGDGPQGQSTTIGYERRHNELLGVGDEGEFVARSTANLRPQPPNFKSIVAINRGPAGAASARRRAADAAPGRADATRR